jgi:hypothetical protein
VLPAESTRLQVQNCVCAVIKWEVPQSVMFVRIHKNMSGKDTSPCTWLFVLPHGSNHLPRNSRTSSSSSSFSPTTIQSSWSINSLSTKLSSQGAVIATTKSRCYLCRRQLLRRLRMTHPIRQLHSLPTPHIVLLGSLLSTSVPPPQKKNLLTKMLQAH